MGRPPCCDKEGVKKGPWTPEEDIILVSYVQEHGPGNWRAVPARTGLLRCSKSCRLRWTNYLRPGIRRGGFSDHEERLIVHLQALLGNRWSAIASYLPHRTDNDIKNFWNTHLKKKLLAANHIVSSSSTPPPAKGDWERKLQTDIGLARQALRDALSVNGAAPPAVTVNAGGGDDSAAYALNARDISMMLSGWAAPSGKGAIADGIGAAESALSEVTGAAECSAASSASNSNPVLAPSASASSKATVAGVPPLSAIESWLLLDDSSEPRLALEVEEQLLDVALRNYAF
uniref:Uncharacterized protein n=1 Tax=Leersia perrieri TaxID=77586 RepID=A0A0D9VUK5_9ORYZ